MFATEKQSVQEIAAIVFVFGAVFATIYVARDILFPLAIAFLIWFVTTSYRRSIARIPLIGKKFSPLALTLISFLISCFTLFVCGLIVTLSVSQFDLAFETYSDNLRTHTQTISAMTGIDIEKMLTPQEELSIESWLQDMFTLATGFFTTTLLVLFYVFFIFIEESTFRRKLDLSFVSAGQRQEAHEIVESITARVYQYLSLKTLISIGTGLAAYAVMVPIGLDFAVLAGFLIFLFNYIPNLGPFIGTGIAVLFALLQFNTLWPVFLILILVGTVQTVSGNIVEPLLMGNRLNLSPLVIMVALVFWSYIWGIFGMFIAVPLTVLIMIVLAHIPQTRLVALWMSEDGDI